MKATKADSQEIGTNTGGYNTTNAWYQPAPCSCAYQGSGTARFLTALGMGSSSGDLYWLTGLCGVALNSVDPMLPLKTENIGWNLISGGAPKSIVYGPGYTITAPATMPKPTYASGSKPA